MLVVVEDDAPVDRGRLTRLLERGPDSGVHVMWVASSVQQLPAACRDFMAVDGDHGTTTGQVRLGRHTFPVSCESLDAGLAAQLARMLTPVVDVGKPLEDDSDLPRAVSYAALIGKDFLDNPAAVAERWTENNSVRASAVPNRKDNGTLRALVGSKGIEPLYLDLKNEGPHALVGGTTGAGKSEFLQSWVMGMAAAYSPDRVSFLFVDYKGGAAFADCLHLPHTVGLVTDLSPHLVRRALTSLRAELHHRERLLNRKKAKDLLELQREADPEAPPYLIIIVDEFAALATEVPEFVDGVVDVAARGRSLGLHLILATQRPAGVIKESLRANTNLRVALRMADEDDAIDILGVPTAAYFDPSIPGPRRRQDRPRPDPGLPDRVRRRLDHREAAAPADRDRRDGLRVRAGLGRPGAREPGQGRSRRSQRHRPDDGQHHQGRRRALHRAAAQTVAGRTRHDLRLLQAAEPPHRRAAAPGRGGRPCAPGPAHRVLRAGPGRQHGHLRHRRLGQVRGPARHRDRRRGHPARRSGATSTASTAAPRG